MAWTDTDSRYGVMDHERLEWRHGERDVSLMAAKAKDGRWFLVAQREGDAAEIWLHVPEICDPWAAPFREPVFYPGFDEMLRGADGLAHQMLGRPAGEILVQWSVPAIPGGNRYKTIEKCGVPIWICRPDDSLDLARFLEARSESADEGITWRPSTPGEISKWNVAFLERLNSGDNPDGLFAVEP
jgi:hypothetical protein